VTAPITTILCHLAALGCYAAEQAEKAEGTNDSDVLWFLVDVLRETMSVARQSGESGISPHFVAVDSHGQRVVSFRAVPPPRPVLRALPGGRGSEPPRPCPRPRAGRRGGRCPMITRSPPLANLETPAAT
jgi:hypothetical protein